MANTKCRSEILFWLPVGVYAAFLFYLSSLHHPHVPRFQNSDKLYHAILYAGFGFLFVRALRPMQRHWKAATVVLTACLGAVFYGMTDEFHQIFVAGRSPDVLDICADAVGGVLGGGLFLLCQYVEKRFRKGKIPGNPQALASL